MKKSDRYRLHFDKGPTIKPNKGRAYPMKQRETGCTIGIHVSITKVDRLEGTWDREQWWWRDSWVGVFRFLVPSPTIIPSVPTTQHNTTQPTHLTVRFSGLSLLLVVALDRLFFFMSIFFIKKIIEKHIGQLLLP